jgi:hypothetical protein
VDKSLTTDVNGTLSNTFRPLIEQNGNFYLASILGQAFSGPGSSGFLTLMQSGLLPTDFQQFDFNVGLFVLGNPSFEIGPMHFGVAQISFLDASGTFMVAYDNLSIDIATVVPEPSTLFLLAIGAINLLGRRRPSNRVQDTHDSINDIQSGSHDVAYSGHAHMCS